MRISYSFHQNKQFPCFFLLYQLEIDLNLKIRKHDNKPEANFIIFLEDKQITEPLRSVRKEMKKLSNFGFSCGHY